MNIVIDTTSFMVLIMLPALIGFSMGWMGGKAEGKAQAEINMPDARRWRYWRRHWYQLASHQCAQAAGLDLRRVYVQSPRQLDQVTDAAIAAQAEEVARHA